MYALKYSIVFPAPTLMKPKLINSSMRTPYILNFTKISPEMWKLQVEVNFCFYIKYTTTELIYMKLIFAEQPFAKDSHTEFYENPSDSLATDTRSRTDRWTIST
jgi:hypothetical protein